jgi:P27 family predicted phage terminase small subunit
MPRIKSPEPRALKLLKGETRPSRVPSWEPEAEDGDVAPPASLSPDAAELWEQYAPELARAGLLRPRNVETFAIWCAAVVEWRKSAALLAATGPVVKGKDAALVSNPASREFARYAELVRRFSIEFGMTPGAVTAMGRQLDGTAGRARYDPARLLS